MKVIIFGTTGFLGGHLKSLPYDVVPINCRNKKFEEWSDEIPADADIFINCIGKAHDHKGTATETEYYDANYYLVKDMFRAFTARKSSLFIHISSIAAVEELQRDEILTEESVCSPVSIYGRSKLAADTFLLGQKDLSEKKIVILRPAMIHGGGDKGNLLLLYKIISKGVPYPLGRFSNSRSFCSVENFIYIIEKIVENNVGLASGVYNVADDEAVSTKKIIALIGKTNNRMPMIVNVSKPIVYAIAKIGDSLRLPVNTKRITKMVGNLTVSNARIKSVLKIQELPLSSEEGLLKTIKSFKK